MRRLRHLFAHPVIRVVCLSLLLLPVAALIVSTSVRLVMAHSGAQSIAASQAAAVIRNGHGRSIEVQADRVYLKTDDAEYVFIKDRESSVPQMLASLGVAPSEMGKLTYAIAEVSPVPWGEIVPTLVLGLLGGGLVLMMIRRSGGGPTLAFGRSRARRFVGRSQQVTFDDVAGASEAKEELLEIVEFLKSPEKFEAMGARIPKGVLLV